MAKVDLKISFECPACKQINEGVSFKWVIDIDTKAVYIGTGEYTSDIGSIYITCTGCMVSTEIDHEASF